MGWGCGDGQRMGLPDLKRKVRIPVAGQGDTSPSRGCGYVLGAEGTDWNRLERYVGHWRELPNVGFPRNNRQTAPKMVFDLHGPDGETLT